MFVWVSGKDAIAEGDASWFQLLSSVRRSSLTGGALILLHTS